MRRVRRRTCAAHFDGLQPKSANLPDGSTALPWPQITSLRRVSEEPPSARPETVRGARGSTQTTGTTRHVQMLPARLIRLMRCVLPALPASGPSGNRVRRREAARLAQRQGAARRSGKTRPAVAAPHSAKALCPGVLVTQANAAMPTKAQPIDSTSYRTTTRVLHSSSVGGRLRDSSHKAVFCEQIVRTTRCNWQNSASEIETNANRYWAIG
jgi:hypothetical protein